MFSSGNAANSQHLQPGAARPFAEAREAARAAEAERKAEEMERQLAEAQRQADEEKAARAEAERQAQAKAEQEAVGARRAREAGQVLHRLAIRAARPRRAEAKLGGDGEELVRRRRRRFPESGCSNSGAARAICCTVLFIHSSRAGSYVCTRSTCS